MRKMLHSTRERESGFTLIELLVVILIIGVLASIAILMFLNQRKAAVDASLQADLKNVATWYHNWRVDPSHTNQAFRSATNHVQVSLDHTGAKAAEAGLPEIKTTEGNTVKITVVNAPYAPHWTDVHEEGEFCLAGTSSGGNYPGGGGAANYNKHLYYDSMLGGVKTVEELSVARAEGADLACYAFVRLWDNAKTP